MSARPCKAVYVNAEQPLRDEGFSPRWSWDLVPSGRPQGTLQPPQSTSASAGNKGRQAKTRIVELDYAWGVVAAAAAGSVGKHDTGPTGACKYGHWGGSEITETADIGVPGAGGPDVAVVTPTDGDPVLLERAATSVAGQHYDNLTWIVANRGGDKQLIRSILARVQGDPGKVTILDADHGGGLAAAINMAIAASSSQMVAVHLDADSWHPDFLARMTGCLTEISGQHSAVKGVVCRSTAILERQCDERIAVVESRPFDDQLMAVTLTDMACANLFPQSSFLFLRSAWSAVGGFDEDLPVLADWEFNLRFLLKFDIAVLPQPLANFHVPHTLGRDVDANARATDRALVEQFDRQIRHRMLRDAAGADEIALALLANLGPNLVAIREGMREPTANDPRQQDELGSAAAPGPEGAGTTGSSLREALLRLRDRQSRHEE